MAALLCQLCMLDAMLNLVLRNVKFSSIALWISQLDAIYLYFFPFNIFEPENEENCI